MGMARVLSDDEIIEVWTRAMEESGNSNPFNRSALRAMGESGLTMVDIRTRLGVILGKRETERSESEKRLLKFYENLKLEFEQGLVDSCMDSAQGSMFLLKTRYGYREGTDLNITAGNEAGKKVVRSWGVDASASSGEADEGSQV